MLTTCPKFKMKPKQSDYSVFHHVLISRGRLDKNRLHFTSDRGIYSLKLYTIISLASNFRLKLVSAFSWDLFLKHACCHYIIDFEIDANLSILIMVNS